MTTPMAVTAASPGATARSEGDERRAATVPPRHGDREHQQRDGHRGEHEREPEGVDPIRGHRPGSGHDQTS